MDWAIYQPRIRFDIRAEREECERLFNHQARVLQDRLVRRAGLPIGPDSMQFQSGRKSAKQKRKSVYYCIRQES